MHNRPPMRVIGGTARGIPLKAVPGDTTRPILDRVKTPLFDILRPDLPGLRVLDLFAGTGAVGIEALSQGAARAVFLDIEKRAVETIRHNLSATKLSDHAEVRLTDAFLYLKKVTESFDLIYIAPPQYKGIWVEALRAIEERPQVLARDGQVIVQIDPKEFEEVQLATLALADRRKYGATELLFFTASDNRKE